MEDSKIFVWEKMYSREKRVEKRRNDSYPVSSRKFDIDDIRLFKYWGVGKNHSPIEMESESEVAQSCPTLCDPIGGSLPGFSVHGIFQARILEWVAISFSNRNGKIPEKIEEKTKTTIFHLYQKQI